MPRTLAVAFVGPVLWLVSVTAVSGRRFGESLGLVGNMTAPSLVVLLMNPRDGMQGAGMMSLFLSIEKGQAKSLPRRGGGLSVV